MFRENSILLKQNPKALLNWDLPLYHWRLPSSYPEGIPSTAKERGKVNKCAGISFKGATEFAVIVFIFVLVLHFDDIF